MKERTITIVNGIATIAETTIIASMTEEDLSQELARLAKLDTGILPRGCIRKTISYDGNIVYTVGFEARVWGDKIKHPPVVFSFNCNTKGSVKKAYIAYAENAMFSESTKLKCTAHANVYSTGEICLGAAFPIPAALTLEQKIDAMIQLYFTADKNGDLDHHMEATKPSSMQQTWEEMSNANADISSMIRDFKPLGNLGDWMNGIL